MTGASEVISGLTEVARPLPEGFVYMRAAIAGSQSCWSDSWRGREIIRRYFVVACIGSLRRWSNTWDFSSTATGVSEVVSVLTEVARPLPEGFV